MRIAADAKTIQAVASASFSTPHNGFHLRFSDYRAAAAVTPAVVGHSKTLPSNTRTLRIAGNASAALSCGTEKMSAPRRCLLVAARAARGYGA